MKLDDLRSVLLSERETGRLTVVAPDTYERAHAELNSLVKKVHEFDDPFSDDARSLIEETIAVRETLRDIFAIRSRKILGLAIIHAEGNYYDREEVRRMIPQEKGMFEGITASISQCQDILLRNAQPTAVSREPAYEEVFDGEPALPEEPETDQIPLSASKAASQPSSPCVLVQVLQDMESFMGVDGRIYTLSKGDLVTLPERNASVLSERNIVLNINLCK